MTGYIDRIFNGYEESKILQPIMGKGEAGGACAYGEIWYHWKTFSLWKPTLYYDYIPIEKANKKVTAKKCVVFQKDLSSG